MTIPSHNNSFSYDGRWDTTVDKAWAICSIACEAVAATDTRASARIKP